MTDLSQTIEPKSSQLNADDLIAGPRTIEITRVVAGETPEQPVALHFKGDNNKPFLPSKSMRRVLVQIWGSNGDSYVGKSMTIYRDEKVMFGGVAVGGIRISNMSGMDSDKTLVLTASKTQRKPFTVRPLVVEEKKRTLGDWLSDLEKSLSMAESEEEISAILETPEVLKVLSGTNEKAKAKIDELSKWARELLSRNYPAEPTLPKPWPIPDIEACLSESDLMRLQNSTAYVTALPTLSVDVMKQVTEAVADAHRRFA